MDLGPSSLDIDVMHTVGRHSRGDTHIYAIFFSKSALRARLTNTRHQHHAAFTRSAESWRRQHVVHKDRELDAAGRLRGEREEDRAAAAGN